MLLVKNKEGNKIRDLYFCNFFDVNLNLYFWNLEGKKV